MKLTENKRSEERERKVEIENLDQNIIELKINWIPGVTRCENKPDMFAQSKN